MSTKIYDGCKLTKPPKNLKEVRDIVLRFKEAVLPHYTEKFFALLARDFVGIFDDASYFGASSYPFPSGRGDKRETRTITGLSLSSLPLLWQIEESIERKAEIFRNQSDRLHEYSDYEFYCHVVCLPCNDEVFVLPFTEETEAQDLLPTIEGIEAYPYWDNTDRPDEASPEQWEKRREEWDEALGTGTPATNGFGIDIVNGLFEVTQPYFGKPAARIEQVLKHIPPFEERVDRIVGLSLGREWDKENRAELEGQIRVADIFGIARRFKQFLSDNPERVKKKRDHVAGILLPEFTPDDLEITCRGFCERWKLAN
jgi:hypothetical protein